MFHKKALDCCDLATEKDLIDITYWHDGGVPNFPRELVIFLLFQISGSCKLHEQSVRKTLGSSSLILPSSQLRSTQE